jgi:hypothetical protein
MGFFKDSKPKKTDEEKHNEWFTKCDRKMDSKHFVVLWASMESYNDIPHIDKMIDEGYELLTVYANALDGTRLVFKKPITKYSDGKA